MSDLPADVLRPSVFPLVRSYAVLSVVAEDIEKLVLANPRNARARDELRRTAATLMSLSVKLRLSPSSRVLRTDGRLDEQNLAAIDDPDGLLGGAALEPPRRGAIQ